MPWIVGPPKGLIEPVTVPTIWIDEIAAVSLNEGLLTAYLASRREDGEQLLEIVVKTRPTIAFDALAKSVRIIQHIAGPVRAWTPRVVR